MKKIETKNKRITSFICGNLCPSCDNEKCNVVEIMEKYKSNWLKPSQMKEVSEFYLHRASCRNHIPNDGFLLIAHKIEIHFVDGRVERKNGWYSSKAVSEVWGDDVEYVDLLFSDL